VGAPPAALGSAPHAGLRARETGSDPHGPATRCGAPAWEVVAAGRGWGTAARRPGEAARTQEERGGKEEWESEGRC
jgi:hypothetical protein